jgi:hypothetical protein
VRTSPRRPIRPLPMRPAARCSAVCALLALTAAGCFGSAGGSASSQAAPAFHDQALAICRSVQRRVVALGSPGTVTSLPELATYGAKVVALQRHELARLRRLQAPATDAATFQAALTAMQAATQAGARLVAYARQGEPGAVIAQQKAATAAVAAANRALVPLGLDTCAA